MAPAYDIIVAFLLRNIVGGVLIGLGGAATLVMLALAPPGGEPDGTDNQQEEKKGPIKVKFHPWKS